jgi:beta-lactam-binding protein with PASTA domain
MPILGTGWGAARTLDRRGGRIAGRGFAAIASVSLAIAIAGCGFFSVPDLTGMNASDATSLAIKQGYNVRAEYDPSSAEPTGTVIGQIPEAGLRVSRTKDMVIHVAGREPVEVPDLRSMMGAVARQALSQLGIQFEFAGSAIDPVLPIGAVVRQEPLPGTVVAKGGVVRVWLSKGPELRSVPELAGLSEAEAIGRLTDAGFVAKMITSHDDACSPGVVASQWPTAGSDVKAGTAVTVDVSTGPKMVEIGLPEGYSDFARDLPIHERVMAETVGWQSVDQGPIWVPARLPEGYSLVSKTYRFWEPGVPREFQLPFPDLVLVYGDPSRTKSIRIQTFINSENPGNSGTRVQWGADSTAHMLRLDDPPRLTLWHQPRQVVVFVTAEGVSEETVRAVAELLS